MSAAAETVTGASPATPAGETAPAAEAAPAAPGAPQAVAKASFNSHSYLEEHIKGCFHSSKYEFSGVSQSRGDSARCGLLVLEHEDDLDTGAPYAYVFVPFSRTPDVSGTFQGTMKLFTSEAESWDWPAKKNVEYKFSSTTETTFVLDFLEVNGDGDPVLQVTGNWSPDKGSYPKSLVRLKGESGLCRWFVQE